jgi:hypothetical protein
MFFKLACRRYRRYETTAREFGLTPAARSFMDSHADACAACRSFSEDLHLVTELLSNSHIEPVLSADFTDRIVSEVRAVRRQGYRTAYRPVIVGAVAAFIAIGAVLQVVGAPSSAPSGEGAAANAFKRESPLNSTVPGDINLFDTPSKLVRDPRPNDV